MMQSRKPGFHTKLSQDLHDRIIGAIHKYVTIRLIAAHVHIHKQTLQRWLKEGSKAVLEADHDSPFAQLYTEFEEVRADTVQRMIENVRSHSEEWQASWSLLKALEREDFGTDGADIMELKAQLEELRFLITKQDLQATTSQEDDDE